MIAVAARLAAARQALKGALVAGGQVGLNAVIRRADGFRWCQGQDAGLGGRQRLLPALVISDVVELPAVVAVPAGLVPTRRAEVLSLTVHAVRARLGGVTGGRVAAGGKRRVRGAGMSRVDVFMPVGRAETARVRCSIADRPAAIGELASLARRTR